MKTAHNITKNLAKTIKSKYFIVTILFVFWILFLDDYNLINQHRINDTVKKLKKQKEFYISEIKKDSLQLYKLKNDTNEQEKFAREKFLMKKKNEDIFIIRKDD